MTEENFQAPDVRDEMGELTRAKVVRELHDGLSQTVSALAMRINYARRLMLSEPESASKELEKVEELTRAATKEIRHIIYLLRPEEQGDFDFVSEIESLAEKMGDLFELEIDLVFQEDLVNQLPREVKYVIYGIVEELIDSARKLNEKNLLIHLSLMESDLAQLKLEHRVGELHEDNPFQEMDLNNIQSYASLIDGSAVLGKDGNLVQVLFPLTSHESAEDVLV